MGHYLLSIHTDRCATDAHDASTEPEAQPPPAEPSEADAAASMAAVEALEGDMRAEGVFLFGGALTDPASATVVRSGPPELAMTDGPYAETKEHIGGFYLIEVDDLDAALRWAGRVVETIGAPIEVRPFGHVSGRAALGGDRP